MENSLAPNKKRILVIEDEALFREMLTAELKKQGYEIHTAVDGIDGLEKMKSQRPDLILLDILMPRKDGFSLLKDMQKDETLKAIPVIVLSNSGDLVEVSHAKELGAREILVKTAFGPKELLEKIQMFFSVTFEPSPGKEVGKQVSVKEEESEGEGESAKPDSKAPSLAHILLIEDDPFLWSLIRSKLTKEGFNVTVAQDGQEGLAHAAKINPDLILLDIILPDLNGFTVLEKLKSNKATSRVPVIILSNLGQQEDLSKGMALGAKDYLIKAHHTPQEIIDKVKEVLGKTDQRPTTNPEGV